MSKLRELILECIEEVVAEGGNAMVQSKAGTTYQSYDKPQDLDKLKQDPNGKYRDWET